MLCNAVAIQTFIMEYMVPAMSRIFDPHFGFKIDDDFLW